MRNKDEVIAKLIDPGIIAVVRAQSRAQVLPLSEALLAGGVHAIEITTSTPEAIEAIGETSQALGERALIGVGTVLDIETCHAAWEAGAEFVVDLENMLAVAGFADIVIASQDESHEFIREWSPEHNLEKYIQSALIEARKQAT